MCARRSGRHCQGWLRLAYSAENMTRRVPGTVVLATEGRVPGFLSHTTLGCNEKLFDRKSCRGIVAVRPYRNYRDSGGKSVGGTITAFPRDETLLDKYPEPNTRKLEVQNEHQQIMMGPAISRSSDTVGDGEFSSL